LRAAWDAAAAFVVLPIVDVVNFTAASLLSSGKSFPPNSSVSVLAHGLKQSAKKTRLRVGANLLKWDSPILFTSAYT
jgi:hypothetical protein